ncbi:sugar-binding transcriptional regulator [Propionispora vibrioides]|uniref:sugar-binding transcriptional regulator n=1 Tax=Propionispora vibrioides TaxID=112903 RepID=UPI000B87485F|nr:sugar-binding transcriptional regulator [Propionispora vibrioides]
MYTVDRRLLIKISEMYYLENKNQNEIAEQFGLNRITVGKYLKKALAEGLVKISIANDSYGVLEKALEKKYGLKEVYIVSFASELGYAGLQYIQRIYSQDDVLGISWGRTLGAVAQAATLERCNPVQADILPLGGSLENVNDEYHVNTIIYKMATAFKARSHYLYAPFFTSSAEAKAVFMQDSNCRRIAALWERLTIAVIGIGSPASSSNWIWSGYFGNEYMELLQQAGGVGDICSRYYDLSGKRIDEALEDRTIAIDINLLKQVRHSIGVAASPAKVEAIYGAIQGQYINVLITDEQTAQLLLEFKPLQGDG